MDDIGAPLITLSNISRTFDDGSVTALSDANLRIESGEFVAIVGPSGSGKTSLVHIMAGFDRPTAGRVLWRGTDVADRRSWTRLRREKIGIVFQEFLLLPTLTALENVEIAMSGTGLSSAERKHRAASLLEEVGLGNRFKHLPFALSGGERQRVAIARGLANRPELLLADEPTGNLDSRNAVAVLNLLLKLRAEARMALVLVTHDETIAAKADRAARIKDGRLESIGVDEVGRAP